MFGIGFITVVSHLRICGTNHVGSKGVTRDRGHIFDRFPRNDRYGKYGASVFYQIIKFARNCVANGRRIFVQNDLSFGTTIGTSTRRTPTSGTGYMRKLGLTSVFREYFNCYPRDVSHNFFFCFSIANRYDTIVSKRFSVGRFMRREESNIGSQSIPYTFLP